MWLIKGEFYSATEYNKTAEYKPFPAELYKRKNELSEAGKEEAKLGEEITTLQVKKEGPSEKKAESESLVNKLFNSMKGVVTSTSAVVAVTALGVATVVAPPKVEMASFLVADTYVEYEMVLENLQEDVQYFVVVTTSNEESLEFLVEESGVYKERIEGLKPLWEYTFSFVGYDEAWGRTTYYEKIFQTTAYIELPPAYSVSVTEVVLSGLDEVCVDFSHAGLTEECSLELWLTYEGVEEQTVVPVSTEELAQGYALLSLSQTAELAFVQPVVRYGQASELLSFEVYECAFDSTLEAEVTVGLTDEKISFRLRGFTFGATYATVMDALTNEEVTRQELYGEVVDFYGDFSSAETLSYTIFLTTEDGVQTTDSYSVEIDTVSQEVGEYIFNYKNPSAVGVTYNEDGTINVYIQTDFETDDERLYYQIQLGEYSFQSRERIFVAEGLPNQSYPLVYDVCYDADGIRYSIYNVSVSGTVNEMGLGSVLTAWVEENEVVFSVSEYNKDFIRVGSIHLCSSSGERITLNESDFVYDEELQEYTCRVTLVNEFEFVEIYGECAPYGENMQGIDNYQGSISTELSMEIYKY